MKMNLPNKLSVLRLCMVPVFVVIMMVSDALWANIAGVLLFIAASLTDMLDGKIARKYNLVTDFGKFLDPLADKFMVIGAMMVILYKVMGSTPAWFQTLFMVSLMVLVFRELAVTSIRLVVSGSSGIVVAANMLGKIKTCAQIACVVACILERILYVNLGLLPDLAPYLPLSTVTTAVMLVFTLWSGVNYIVSYWKYMDPQK